jgi:hypothetical protein
MIETLSLLFAGVTGATDYTYKAPSVRAAAIPERVCASEREPGYLNVDFAVDNVTDKEVSVSELRATVTSPTGSVIEKRLVWQGALDLLGLGVAAKIAPRSRGVVFNPFHFSAATPGTSIKYEFHFAGQVAPAVVQVTPRLCRTTTPLRLPLSGRVLVLDGHDALSHHRRFNFFMPWAQKEGFTDNVQRYALDLVAVDPSGSPFTGAGDRNEQFHGWEQLVRAPAGGVVVAARNDQPDNDKVGSENRWTGKTWDSASGNYVLIRHNDGEFSEISHLRQNSVTVRAGDVVRTGQTIGKVGNSGSSLMPHIHYQLKNAAGQKGVSGIPAYFRAVRYSSGQRVPAHGIVLDTGDIVLAE